MTMIGAPSDKTSEARGFPSSKLTILRKHPIFCDLESEALDQLCRYATWYGVLAPAKTPNDIIARLNAEVVKAIGDPDVRHKLEELGFAPRGTSPEELRNLTRDQLAKYARVIKDMGLSND